MPDGAAPACGACVHACTCTHTCMRELAPAPPGCLVSIHLLALHAWREGARLCACVQGAGMQGFDRERTEKQQRRCQWGIGVCAFLGLGCACKCDCKNGCRPHWGADEPWSPLPHTQEAVGMERLSYTGRSRHAGRRCACTRAISARCRPCMTPSFDHQADQSTTAAWTFLACMLTPPLLPCSMLSQDTTKPTLTVNEPFSSTFTGVEDPLQPSLGGTLLGGVEGVNTFVGGAHAPDSAPGSGSDCTASNNACMSCSRRLLQARLQPSCRPLE